MKYRQITHRLRVQRGPGRPDFVSERPRDPKSGKYLDDGPPLIEFDAHCQVDVESLIRSGALAREPEPTAPAKAKGAASG